MKMNKILTATAFVAAVALSTNAYAATPYVEGQIGYANPSKFDTNTYSGTEDGLTWTNAKLSANYDSSASFGAEFGFKDVAPNIRLGASFTTMKFDFENTTLSGSITDGVDTLSGSATFSAADFASVGVNLDTRVNIYMANAYYDFKNDSKFTPFVGFGVGVADIKIAEDKAFAYSVNAGAQYSIDKNIYVSAKAAYTNIDGPKGDIGIEFKNIDLYTVNVALGFEF